MISAGAGFAGQLLRTPLLVRPSQEQAVALSECRRRGYSRNSSPWRARQFLSGSNNPGAIESFKISPRRTQKAFFLGVAEYCWNAEKRRSADFACTVALTQFHESEGEMCFILSFLRDRSPAGTFVAHLQKKKKGTALGTVLYSTGSLVIHFTSLFSPLSVSTSVRIKDSLHDRISPGNMETKMSFV